MKDLTLMNEKELKRAEIVPLVTKRQRRQGEAAEELGISTRQLRRLCARYREQGVKGLASQRRSKASNRRLPQSVVLQALARIRELYEDFGPTLAHEKLTEEDGFKISLSSVRRAMVREGIWMPKKQKEKRIHPRRDRRAQFGELVQIDGSPHAWFEDRAAKCCLIVFIDDATSALLALHFAPSESTESYFRAVDLHLSQYGLPRTYYSDKHGIFRVNSGSNMDDSVTQFGRVMKGLGIKTICAHSPQAKGRVERANSTLQDRLVKELRLRGISSIEEANAYLPEYIKAHNKRFSVEARDPVDAHRALTPKQDMELILNIHETRKISKSLSFQYGNTHYQILMEGWRARMLIGQPVTIATSLNGSVRVLHKGKELTFTDSIQVGSGPRTIDSKTLNPDLDTILEEACDDTSRTDPEGASA